MDGDGSHNAQTSEPQIQGAASRTTIKHTLETCTICLEPISERAVATPCNHLTFDFLCLVSWLQEQQNCPLCKAEVKEVQYDWRSPEDYKTYHVPRTAARRSGGGRGRGRRHFFQVAAPVDPALERRREIYRHCLYALRVGSNSLSQYREFSPEEFARSAELQSKARTFLRRELQIFTFLGNREFLMEYIVAILKKYEIKAADGKAEELLKEFLGEANARILLHELQAWLRSPFRALGEWDGEVRYAEGSGEGIKRSG